MGRRRRTNLEAVDALGLFCRSGTSSEKWTLFLLPPVGDPGVTGAGPDAGADLASSSGVDLGDKSASRSWSGVSAGAFLGELRASEAKARAESSSDRCMVVDNAESFVFCRF